MERIINVGKSKDNIFKKGYKLAKDTMKVRSFAKDLTKKVPEMEKLAEEMKKNPAIKAAEKKGDMNELKRLMKEQMHG